MPRPVPVPTSEEVLPDETEGEEGGAALIRSTSLIVPPDLPSPYDPPHPLPTCYHDHPADQGPVTLPSVFGGSRFRGRDEVQDVRGPISPDTSVTSSTLTGRS